MQVTFLLFFIPGSATDRDSDDGQNLSLQSIRRPSISAPISTKKSTNSRVHTPPANSSVEILEDGVSSTPIVDSEGMHDEQCKRQC